MVPRIWETVVSHLGTGGDGMSTGLKSKITVGSPSACFIFPQNPPNFSSWFLVSVLVLCLEKLSHLEII